MKKETYIVDDNPDHHFLLYRAIKGFSGECPVRFFEDGKVLYRHLEALARQGRTNEFPSLLIVDLNMPGMNGMQLLRLLRQPKPELQGFFEDLPLVIMSSETGEDKIQQCYQLGANAFITKPFDFDEVRNTMKSIIRFWLDKDLEFTETH
ncbi:response regulator [Dyadobacter sp. CY326]|uniref:response regulator n=1 Tax=Dyadobacter sp. CY326 TaxID=2907300 RepID=UPI001F43EF98|nr:response regulator [Dyadobacter sp. CY326]MCE7066944.1 response regulator [Dyadobacter sp. CY326]